MGILNGVDSEAWNPETDKLIAANYSLADMSGKAACKKALQKRMGLKVSQKIPVFGVVSRLYSQKGLDLLARIAADLVSRMDIQIALLGSGEYWQERAFSDLTAAYPGKISAYIGFDNGLAHQIEAGSDFFLMPSRFEPCGLNQMYSMMYGALPVVRSTGGLCDTVDQYSESTGSGDGFRFSDPTCEALYNTIGWACSTWYDRPDDIEKNAAQRHEQGLFMGEVRRKVRDGLQVGRSRPLRGDLERWPSSTPRGGFTGAANFRCGCAAPQATGRNSSAPKNSNTAKNCTRSAQSATSSCTVPRLSPARGLRTARSRFACSISKATSTSGGARGTWNRRPSVWPRFTR